MHNLTSVGNINNRHERDRTIGKVNAEKVNAGKVNAEKVNAGRVNVEKGKCRKR